MARVRAFGSRGRRKPQRSSQARGETSLGEEGIEARGIAGQGEGGIAERDDAVAMARDQHVVDPVLQESEGKEEQGGDESGDRMEPSAPRRDLPAKGEELLSGTVTYPARYPEVPRDTRSTLGVVSVGNASR